MILVTAMPPNDAPGAVPSLPVAKRLAEQLLSKENRVRILVPESETRDLPQKADIVVGSVANPEVMSAAFDDVESVCIMGLVSFVPDKLRELANLIIKGKAKRVVMLFSHGSDLETQYSPETWQWLAFEQAMEKRGIAWTYVRPTGLFANALVGGYPITNARWARKVRAGESVREYKPDMATLFMDEKDVAEVIAKILLQGGYEGEAIDIAGEASSANQRLEVLRQKLNKEILSEPLESEEAARSYWKSEGYSDIMINVTLFIVEAYIKNEEVNKSILAKQRELTEEILGHAPRTFEEWLNDNIERF